MIVMSMSYIDEVSRSYFRKTPSWEWSYTSFLGAMESFWIPIDQVSTDDNSIFRKQYSSILKNILSEEPHGKRGKYAASLLEKDDRLVTKEFWERVNHDKLVASTTRKRAIFKQKTEIDVLNILDATRTSEVSRMTNQLNTEQFQSEDVSRMNLQNSTESGSITESKDEEGRHENEGSDKETPLSEGNERNNGGNTALDYGNYEKIYNGMEDAKKWRLTTGTMVEDALFKFGMRCRHEHLSHSFILDPEDNNYLKEMVFTRDELDEIRQFESKKFKKEPLDLLEYLDSFDVETTSALRERISQSFKMDPKFDRGKDFDRDWIRNTVYNLLLEYEADTLSSGHLEDWFLVHIWGFIDRIFLDIKGMEAIRGESCSIPSSNRKNLGRTVSAMVKMKRKILGGRADLILRKITVEYGCAEAGRHFDGQNSTKLLQEGGLKMPKMMKDIFNDLCELVNDDEQKIRRLETIGFLHAGLMIMLLRLDSPAGYICRVTRTKSLSVGRQMVEFGSQTLPVLLLVWKAKAIVSSMISLIEERDRSCDKEDRLNRLANILEEQPGLHLPPCLATPPKKRRMV